MFNIKIENLSHKERFFFAKNYGYVLQQTQLSIK